MEKINLFLMDMTESNTTSGVDRYLDMLLKGMAWYPDINVYRIKFLHSTTELLYTDENKGHYREITIPLPQLMNHIIDECFWMQKYNEVVYHLINHLFNEKKRILIHTHTLNLIDLALYIRSKINCHIITHLHCMPWKSLYNHNRRRFNILYEDAYLKPLANYRWQQFIGSSWELRAYEKSDSIICVTECARKFVRQISSDRSTTVDVIPNGIADFSETKTIRDPKKKIVELIYAGVLSESKGLLYILEAMRKVEARGYKVRLNIAGSGSPRQIDRIKQEYADLNLNLLGCIPFDELRKYYESSDIGVIASLQEQASYAAIEMACSGLPIVTTAVDGLDETFTDELNALKVNVLFSKLRGLTVDVNVLSNKIIELITDTDKRSRLGKNARKLYEEKLKLQQMLRKTVAVYRRYGK